MMADDAPLPRDHAEARGENMAAEVREALQEMAAARAKVRDTEQQVASVLLQRGIDAAAIPPPPVPGAAFLPSMPL